MEESAQAWLREAAARGAGGSARLHARVLQLLRHDRPAPALAAGAGGLCPLPSLRSLVEKRSEERRAFRVGAAAVGRVVCVLPMGAIVQLHGAWPDAAWADVSAATDDREGGGSSERAMVVERMSAALEPAPAEMFAHLHHSSAYPRDAMICSLSEPGLCSPPWLVEGEYLIVAILANHPNGHISLSLRHEDCANASARAALGVYPGRPPAARLSPRAALPSALAMPLATPALHELIAAHRPSHAPHAVRRLLRAAGVAEHASCLGDEPPALPTFAQLRAEQNHEWAAQNVARGVAHARAGKATEAFASYKHALELDSGHVDAFVARGALLANGARFREAMDDFRTALRLCPGHANATKYMQLTAKKLDPPRAPSPRRPPDPPAPPRADPRGGGSSAAAAATAPAPSAAGAPSDGGGAAERGARLLGGGLLDRMVAALRGHKRERHDKSKRKKEKRKHVKSRRHKERKHEREKEGGERSSKKRRRSSKAECSDSSPSSASSEASERRSPAAVEGEEAAGQSAAPCAQDGSSGTRLGCSRSGEEAGASDGAALFQELSSRAAAVRDTVNRDDYWDSEQQEWDIAGLQSDLQLFSARPHTEPR
ncbi:hypothetical protein AB1Y20_002940 [Prymnesium parvum]|uniref:Tetratricopeptide repeat protein 14 n=1 Tax=Prymnesium parvum TaxID=97485 RepID=A0AB34JC07_PRYPA